LQRVLEALAICQEGLRHSPQDPDLLNALGNSLGSLDRLDEAGAAYQQALAHRPDWSVPRYNLGLSLLNRGRLAEAWAALKQAMKLAPGDRVAHSTYLGSLLYDPDTSGAAYLEEAARWVERHASGLPPPAPHGNSPDPERRLRLGYVSPDFRSHAVAFFLEPILANHDPHRFEVFCYAEVSAPDEVTARLRGLVPHWRDTVGLSDDELAAHIRQDGIDVLVEMGGHLAGNRLLACARRPAPVQVSYLGYPASSGLASIPYRLADAVTAAAGEPLGPGEALVLLPGPFCCYLPPPRWPLDPTLPSRRRGLVTFGSMHKLAKLNGAVVDLWARLLQEVPGSRLLLCRSTLLTEDVAWFVEQFRRRGVGPGRVILSRPEVGAMRHLRAYGDIDVVLDTFPWSGHTTACEALWMGVPVVTLKGASYAGRMTAGALESLGLGDWAADTPEDYVWVAQQLAGDEGLRAQLHGSLRDRLLASPLCDGAGFTRGLEEIYRQLWRRWCGGLKKCPDSPDTFWRAPRILSAQAPSRQLLDRPFVSESSGAAPSGRASLPPRPSGRVGPRGSVRPCPTAPGRAKTHPATQVRWTGQVPLELHRRFLWLRFLECLQNCSPLL
jgi:predicted O-linked N-acetylglucosamine transferase (SPINDLY family)